MNNRTEDYPRRYVARLTIEFKSPFFIGAGEEEIFTDEVFVADANGLPAIPGSSIAGVLRRQIPADADKLFGYQKDSDGDGSRLSVSWACIHDKDNKPVEGLKPSSEIAGDVVLSQAMFALARDHVLIDDRGVAETGGKFDEKCVAAGHRFTFEMTLEGKKEDETNWEKLLISLASGTVRLGGKTRRSYGVFEVKSLKEKVFNLQDEKDFQLFSELPVSLTDDKNNLTDNMKTYEKENTGDILVLNINLVPEDFWFVGGGDGETDMSPIKTQFIKWTNNTGSVVDAYYLPGTALKGPLAHRVAYYYNGLIGAYADKGEIPAVGEDNPAVRALFGFAKNNENEEKENRGKQKAQEGQAGKVFIDDVIFEETGSPPAMKVLNHVSIDRFTGGARTKTGGLFSEAAFFEGPTIPVHISITGYDSIKKEDEDGKVRKSLKLALTDLAEGQLSIGSGAGRGNGFFKAQKFQWSDNGEWIS